MSDTCNTYMYYVKISSNDYVFLVLVENKENQRYRHSGEYSGRVSQPGLHGSKSRHQG